MNYLNFNNAGASTTFPSSNKEIIKYLKLEEMFGGYHCADLLSNKLNKFYLNLSKLINCKPYEISFIANTTLGFNLFINSLKKFKNYNVVIFSNEYESNLICLINNKINFKVVKIDENGDFNIDELKSKIDKKTLFVNLCHINSNIGNVNPAQKIGKIIKSINTNVIYSIDACQSIGHINVDVKKFRCDVLIGSGRKFLRGPRGTGFIFLRKMKNLLIQPHMIDTHNSSMIDTYNSSINSKIRIKPDHVFENFEYSPALKIGLSESIKRVNDIGVLRIEKDIKLKSNYFRDKLKKENDFYFHENKDKVSGINTLTIKNHCPKKVFNFLLSKKIITSVVEKKNYFLNKNKKSDALRISFHYYNTYKQIDYLIKCISRI